MLLAYIFYSHQSLLRDKFNNRGLLIKPTVNLDSVTDTHRINPNKKWLLISFVTDPSCTNLCLKLLQQQLYKMRQVHIAMHRSTDRVKRHLFVTAATTPEMIQKQLAAYPLMTSSSTSLADWRELLGNFTPPKTSTTKSAFIDKLANYIFIVDPDNYLVTAYHTQQHSGKDLIKDLSKLLRGSQKG